MVTEFHATNCSLLAGRHYAQLPKGLLIVDSYLFARITYNTSAASAGMQYYETNFYVATCVTRCDVFCNAGACAIDSDEVADGGHSALSFLGLEGYGA